MADKFLFRVSIGLDPSGNLVVGGDMPKREADEMMNKIFVNNIGLTEDDYMKTKEVFIDTLSYVQQMLEGRIHEDQVDN